MDAAGAAQAHLVGLSMGGLILIDVASRHPERVRSCFFVSAMSPDPEGGIGEEFFAEPVSLTDDEPASTGGRPPRPDARDRHQAAAMRFGWPEHERLFDILVPTTIVHGAGDRVLPVRHAQALERGIEGSSCTSCRP